MSQMIEVKVAEAEGAALDWLTGSTEGLSLAVDRGEYGTGPRVFLILEHGIFRYRPSTEWVQCGPLRDKHQVEILHAGDMVMAKLYGLTDAAGDGPTALIAICRAIVKAKLGDKVMVPTELAASKQEAS